MAHKISTMKKRKKELAKLQRELEKLRREEEAVKVPVARLHELLNTQLDNDMNESVDDESKTTLNASNFFMCVPGVAACHGSNADEEDQTTVNSGMLENQPDDDASAVDDGASVDDDDAYVEDDETRTTHTRIDHILDVICC